MSSLKKNMMDQSMITWRLKDWDWNISSRNQNNVKLKREYLHKFLAFSIIAISFVAIIINATENMNYGLILKNYRALFTAFVMTLGVSLITLVLSMISGFVFYICMISENKFIKSFTNMLKEIVMGTPLLVMIFLVVYVFGIKVNFHNKLVLGIVALSAYMSPYIANSYKTAIAVIDDSQYKVMNLYNFSLYQRYRFIIVPQIVRPLIPSMLNNLSSIIKGSALLKIVSVSEISYTITVISNENYAVVEGYLIMWIMYLMITIPLSMLAKNIGRRYEI
ncbi:MAG: ABC transporter permease subunit [Tissierellales bacterium]|nr:ABC transporter permease subunit [Tissierellales bacterium]